MISVIVPTLNESKNIQNCLQAIFDRKPSTQELEVIIVDNYSDDNTVELANNFPVKIIYNKIRDAEISKLAGLREASGEYFIYLDADITLRSEKFFTQLLCPLEVDDGISGAFGRFAPDPSASSLARYLRYHPFELDPVLAWFCPDITDIIIESSATYDVVDMGAPRVPPVGICLYRTPLLREALQAQEKFMDIDVPILVADLGFPRFAYVPNADFYHSNINTVNDVVKRRLRNLNQVFLPAYESRRYIYFDVSSKFDIWRILALLVMSNALLPFLIQGAVRALKYRDWALMWHPIIAFVLTNSIMIGMIKSPRGRAVVINAMKTFVGIK
jgi:glycosyltransferase involved in cell wall biosynthesis